MLNFAPSYQHALSSDVRDQRYTVAIQLDATNTFYLTSHTDAGRPSGAVVVDECIKSLSGGTQRLDSKNTSSSIGAVTLECVDLNNAISTLLASYDAQGLSIRNKKITFYYGYASFLKLVDVAVDTDPFVSYEDVDWLDYFQRFTMIITDFTQIGERFVFKCADVQRLEDKTIFLPHETQLRETISSTDMLMPINELVTTTKFPLLLHDADYSDRPDESVGYVIIEEENTLEVISHSGIVDDPQKGVCLQVLERGVLGSRALGHQVDPDSSVARRTKIAELIYFEGPALKLLYAIQTRRLVGQAITQSGSEDVFDDNVDPLFPEHWSQNIDPSFVRLSDYKSDPIANTSPGSFEMIFYLRKKENSFDFVAKELMRWVFGLRPVYGNGEIGFKRQAAILSDSSYSLELTDADIVKHGELSVGLRDVINDYSISWDQRYADGVYNRTVRHIDTESIVKYSDGSPRSFEFKGVKTTKNNDQALTNFVEFYRNRFSAPPYRTKLSVFEALQNIEVADNIRVRSDVVRDPILNAPLDRVFEVQRITPSRNGFISLDLFASGEKPFLPIVAVESFVMQDGYYTQTGNDLASLPEVVNGVLTANASIAGGDTYGQGVWYMDGDFEIAAGVTLTITQNVMLRIHGQLIFGSNALIDGKGQGHAGGAGGTTMTGAGVSNAGLGADGLGGAQFPGRGYTLYAFSFILAFIQIDVWDSLYTRTANSGTTPFSGRREGGGADHLPIINEDGQSLALLDGFDGRGLSGQGGHATLATKEFNAVLGGTNPPPGGNGGAGGASLCVVARGVTAVSSSLIDLSGLDAADPAATPVTADAALTWSCLGGIGAPGCPGALYVFIDGPGTNGLVRAQNFRADRGQVNQPPSTTVFDAPLSSTHIYSLFNLDGEASIPAKLGRLIGPAALDTIHAVPEQQVIDASDSMYRYQLIPAPEGTEPSRPAPDYALAAPSGVVLASGGQFVELAGDGSYNERIRVSWSPSQDYELADQYEVQARRTSDADFRTVAYVTAEQTEAFFGVDDGQEYIARVRATTGEDGLASSLFATSNPHTVVGLSDPPVDPTGFTVSLRPAVGAVFTVDQHPDVDFKRFLFYQGNTFSTATFLFDSSSQQNLSAPLASTEALTFWVVAEDRTGNVSTEVSSVAVVNNPDSVIPASSFAGANVVIQWPIPASSFVIDYYEVEILGSVVSESKSTSFQTRVSWTGSTPIAIVAVDIAGNRSASIDVVVNPSLPAAPVLTALKTAANQFKLVYAAVVGDLPIDAYIVSVGSLSSPTEVLEKAGSSTFTTISEDTGGDYDYFVQARDTAGNIGPVSAITVRLEDSTDLSLILTDSQASSSFAGTRTNILDDSGDLILPVPDGRLWQDKYSSYATIQAKIDAGFPEFLQPAAATATYVYTVDVGAVIAQATAQVLVSLEQLVGTVTAAVSLEQSDDDVSYSSVTTVNGAGQAINFRYIRATITFTPTATTDLAKLLEISTTILTVAREESGTFTSTTTAGGDTVTLDQPFADIQSIIATAKNFDQIDASFDWADPNPTEFKAQIFDIGTSNRYSGEVGYTVKGI